jgi:hypothetical protein
MFQSARSKSTQLVCALQCKPDPLLNYAVSLSQLHRLRCRHTVNHPCSARYNRTSRARFLAPAASPLKHLFHFFVRRVLTARFAKLSRLEPVGMLLPVLRSRVISVFAVVALQRDNFSHMFCSLS